MGRKHLCFRTRHKRRVHFLIFSSSERDKSEGARGGNTLLAGCWFPTEAISQPKFRKVVREAGPFSLEGARRAPLAQKDRAQIPNCRSLAKRVSNHRPGCRKPDALWGSPPRPMAIRVLRFGVKTSHYIGYSQQICASRQTKRNSRRVCISAPLRARSSNRIGRNSSTMMYSRYLNRDETILILPY